MLDTLNIEKAGQYRPGVLYEPDGFGYLFTQHEM